MASPLPCDRHGEARCGACAIASREAAGQRRMRRAVRDSGIALILVGLIVLLLSFAARAEEPDAGVREVPEGVACLVPGRPGLVPLPAGAKLVPAAAWVKLDAELKRLQAIDTSHLAREAELERQYVERLVQALTGGVAAGLVVGFAVAWVVKSQPGS